MLTWDGQAEIEIEFRAPSLAAANQMVAAHRLAVEALSQPGGCGGGGGPGASGGTCDCRRDCGRRSLQEDEEEDDDTADEEEGTCKAELKQALVTIERLQEDEKKTRTTELEVALATIERQAAELQALRDNTAAAASGKNTEGKAMKAGGAAPAARRMQGQQDDGAVALTTVRATHRTQPCCVGLTTSLTAWLAALQVGGAPAACAVSPCDLRGACLHGARSQAAPPPSSLSQAHHCRVSVDAPCRRR